MHAKYQQLLPSRAKINNFMKATLLKLASCLMLIGMVNVCTAGGNVTSQSRNVEPFTGIKLTNSANVYVTKGDVQSVKIEAEQKAITKITTTVKDGKLIIGNDGNLNTDKEIKITITVKELCSASISGSGNIESTTTFNCKEFSAHIAGSGNIKMLIDASTLDASVSGSGNIVLSGKATKSKVHISGSGLVDLRSVTTADASVSISGSGDCKINATDNLESKITGSGNVLYVKEPVHHTEKSTGSGEVKKL
jgi:hypothetical protein